MALNVVDKKLYKQNSNLITFKLFLWHNFADSQHMHIKQFTTKTNKQTQQSFTHIHMHIMTTNSTTTIKNNS